MASFDEIIADPLFRQADRQSQIEVLSANDPGGFGAASPEDKVKQVENIVGFQKLEAQQARRFQRSGMRGSTDLEPGQPPPMTLDEARLGRSSLMKAPLPAALSTVGSVVGNRVAGPVGGAVGAGVGAVGGDLLNPSVLPMVGADAPAYPTLKESVKTFALTAGADLLGRRMLTPEPRGAPGPTLRAFEDTGVTPKPTDVSGSRALAMAENATGMTLTGSPFISGAKVGQAEQIDTAVAAFRARLSGRGIATSGEKTGVTLSERVAVNAEAFKTATNEGFDNLARIARGVPVYADEFQLAALKIRSEETKAGAAGNKELLRQVESYLRDPRQVTWERARAIQKALGRSTAPGVLIRDLPEAEATMLWKGLTSDMERAAVNSGRRDVQYAFQQSRALYERGAELFKDSELAKALDVDPEKFAEQLIRGGVSVARRAKDALLGDPNLMFAHNPAPADTEAWALYQRHTFEGIFQLARDKSAKGFPSDVLPISGTKLSNLMERMGEDKLGVLLDAPQREALESIRRVAVAYRGSEKFAAQGFTSSTTQTGGMFALLGATGEAAGRAVGLPTYVGGALAYLFAPPILAKVITSPALARELGSDGFRMLEAGLRLGGPVPREAMMSLGRLGAILFSGEQGTTQVDPARINELAGAR